MSIIWTILIGFLIGLVAKFLMPGRDPAGFIITVLIGIAGSVIASYLGGALGWYRVGEPAGFLASVIGAMLLLFGYRMVSGNRG
ncbi:GlsB/YeaQ/YmgE family stress response membrane protein [Rhodoferax sp.]|uniref:GlsB/YeaQ/YmgE family stress response membrane protein n=1 Tax=Rhodoferax sp. TaxID=50421 RepID=UPI00374D1B4E